MKSHVIFLLSGMFVLHVSLSFGQVSNMFLETTHPTDFTTTATVFEEGTTQALSKSVLAYGKTNGDKNYLQLDVLDYKYSTSAPDDKCAKYTRMRKVGTGLLIPGAVSSGVGLILIVGGVVTDEVVPRTIGAIVLPIGLVALGVGLPLKIIGNIKSRQYCNDSTSMVYIRSSKNGLGLQYQF